MKSLLIIERRRHSGHLQSNRYLHYLVGSRQCQSEVPSDSGVTAAVIPSNPSARLSAAHPLLCDYASHSGLVMIMIRTAILAHPCCLRAWMRWANQQLSWQSLLTVAGLPPVGFRSHAHLCFLPLLRTSLLQR